MIRLTHFAILWRRVHRIWLHRWAGCTVGRACESEHEGLVLEESWRLVSEQGQLVRSRTMTRYGVGKVKPPHWLSP